MSATETPARPEDVLSALRSLRPSGCPNDATLFALDVGELSRRASEATEAHVGGCPACRSFLDELHRSFDALPTEFQSRVMGAMHVASAKPSKHSENRAGRALTILGALAAAASAFVFLTPPSDRPATLSKGGLELTVYRERAGQVSNASSGDAFYPGDRLRFSVDLPKAAFVAIVGVESSGRRYPAFPSGGGPAKRLEAGSGQLLSDAIALDSAMGRETLYLVACESPFELSKINPEALDASCRARSFQLDKTEGPDANGGR